MNLRRLLFLTLIGLGIFSTSWGGSAEQPTILPKDGSMTVSARFGMLTSIRLVSDSPIKNAVKGGPEINIILDENILHVQPAVPHGLSTITFVHDGHPYVIKVEITEDVPANLTPTFTFKAKSPFEDLDRRIANAPRLRPEDIQINRLIKTIDQAKTDPDYRQTLRGYATLPIRKIYDWNKNEIHFLEAHQFADLDLILFKISWVNQLNQALYLDASQYEIWVANKEIHAQVRQQMAPRSIIFPRQQETVWIAVQGYRLRLDNDWDLRLPPDAQALDAYSAR